MFFCHAHGVHSQDLFAGHFLDHFGLELRTILFPGFLLHARVSTLRADQILSEILGALYLIRVSIGKFSKK